MDTTNLTPDAVKAAAEQAGQKVAELQDLLPIDDGLLDHDRKVANIRQGVPTAAIETAVSVLEELGNKGGGFDLDQARLALAFEKELGRVATKLHVLADRLDATILKRRSTAAATAGGLYKGLQGMARTDGTVKSHLAQLRPHLVRRHKAAAKSAQAPEATSPATAPTGNTGHAVTAPSVTITPAGVVAEVTKP